MRQVVISHLVWDELLMFAIPIVLGYIGLRWWEARRHDAESRRTHEDSDG